MTSTKKREPKTIADHLARARSFVSAQQEARARYLAEPNEIHLSDDLISEILAEEEYAEAAILLLRYLLS